MFSSGFFERKEEVIHYGNAELKDAAGKTITVRVERCANLIKVIDPTDLVVGSAFF